MPLRVGDICYHLMKLNCVRMKIEIGKSGLTQFALRVTAAEHKKAAALVEKYDMAFVSGQHGDAFVLAQMVLERGASAIVLNSGTCSADTRRLIADLCTQANVALIEIEEYGHFSIAMGLFEKEVQTFEKKRAKMHCEWQNILVFQDSPHCCASVMEAYQERMTMSYCVVVLQLMCKNGTMIDQNILSHVVKFVEIGMNEVAEETTAVLIGNRIALIFDGKAEDTVKKATESAIAAIPAELTDAFAIYAGAGRRGQGMEHLAESFATALKAAGIQAARKREKNLLSYEALGISKLLMELDPHSSMAKDFYCETIQPLVEYDRRNNTDLVSLLRTYFEYSGHIKQMAEELYMHRNSVNYKMNKISEIVRRDLSNTEDRAEMLVALKLYELWFGEDAL